MNETLNAILAGIVLVLLSMLGGVIIYVVVQEHIKHKISGNK